MPKKTSMLWLFSSAAFVYFVFVALGGTTKSRPARNSAQDMATARLPDRAEDRKVREQQGEFYIPGDNRQWRVSFGNGPGASVRGWPSKGGLYTLYPCFTVELDFLGLDRFRPADRPQSSTSAAAAAAAEADEEAHCRRMRQLGAEWWPSADDEARWSFENPEGSWELTKPVAYFGWPARGGVWVLSTTIIGASQMGAGRIHIAVTMDERCKIMEDLGAVYYARPEDCPLLDLSDEAVPAT